MTPQETMAVLASDKARTVAEGLVQREVVNEITLPNQWKVTLWNVSFPSSTPASPNERSKTYFREELMLSSPEPTAQPQLVYAGMDERSAEFASKTEGYRALYDARINADGMELLLSDKGNNVTLMRLKMQGGTWEYNGDVSIPDTATASHTAYRPKLLGDGKVQVEWSGEKKSSVFEVSQDGVVKKDGVLYRPVYTSFNENYSLENGYRLRFRLGRQGTREELESQGILKRGSASADVPAAALLSDAMPPSKTAHAENPEKSAQAASADQAAEGNTFLNTLLWVLGASALLLALAIRLWCQQRRKS